MYSLANLSKPLFHHSYSVEQQNEFTLDVDLNLPAVGITVVFGESGSGKTTLLRCIAGAATGS